MEDLASSILRLREGRPSDRREVQLKRYARDLHHRAYDTNLFIDNFDALERSEKGVATRLTIHEIKNYVNEAIDIARRHRPVSVVIRRAILTP
jgi:hypothetical protein